MTCACCCPLIRDGSGSWSACTCSTRGLSWPWRIDVENTRQIYVTRGSAIEPDVAAEAGVPAGMTVAFFAQHIRRSEPYSFSGPLNSRKEQYDISARLMRGLAVRLGGVALHEAAVLEEPLRATIYTARQPGAGQVYEIAAKYARGLEAYDDPTFGPVGVSTWRTGDGQFKTQHWPQGTVSLLRPHAPRAIGGLFFHTAQSTAVRLQLSTPANRADPGTARLLGECALEIAAMMGGHCVDQLGFVVQRPEELVFRQPTMSFR